MRQQTDTLPHDFMEVIRLTENISTKINGISDEAHIYRIVHEESAQSKYAVSILLLTGDGSKLTIAEVPLSPQKVKAVEKAFGLQLKGYTIDLDQSPVCRHVVKEGKTVHVCVHDIVTELFPQSVALSLSEPLGTEKFAIMTPLKRRGTIIGIIATTSTELAEHSIPPVKILAQTIAAALELSSKDAECKRAEQEKERALNSLQRQVKELSCLYHIDEIMKKNTAIEEILTEIVHAIPSFWQNPDMTGSCITFGGKEYGTGNFKTTTEMLKADFTVNEKPAGRVEVCYLGKTDKDEDPFLKEEKTMVTAIAQQLGEFFEHKKAEEKLKHIAWLVRKSTKPEPVHQRRAYGQPYGNLAAINRVKFYGRRTAG